MVNKPHPPRQGNKNSKKAVPATSNDEDTSFIVFGNEDRKKKSRPNNDANAVTGSSGSKANASAAPQPDAEKKPDTRTLIAGSSWTGKLPQTLFNELCQKQKWEKPEYTMRQSGKGFSGGVVLRQKNPKTQEITQLPPILLPPEYREEKGWRESAVEARHLAATYALYRVANQKNIHMTLPPQYRDLWKGDFEVLRREARENGQGYLYEADPFLAKKQHDEQQAAKAKARAQQTIKREEDKKQQVVGLDGQVQSKHVLKGWQKAPKVEMGVKTRRDVEQLVRSDGVWNPNGVRLDDAEIGAIRSDLGKAGFRDSHIEEAAEVCKDREECLEWLLIHVPEDDLPKWALPDNYLAGVSLASGDLVREGKLKRLCAGGYATDVAAEVLDSCSGDEARAAEMLQARLFGVEVADADDGEHHALWDEELVALEAILGDRFTNHDRICTAALELKTPSGAPIVLRARPPRYGYPMALPILAIETDLPAYIRLSILKRCLSDANDTFVGDQMLWNIIDWLEREIPGIIKQPGPLRDIANATSTAVKIENNGSTSKATRSRPRPKPISWQANSPISKQLLDRFNAKQSTSQQQRMLEGRRQLPAWRLQDSIVRSVTHNQVTIISGETGSGKSTQSVQFVLDDLINRCLGEHANIICTQPRRISALGLADRVADERCVPVGSEVGYAIRGESKHKTGETKILFVTTGVLLRRLQTSGGSADDVVRSLADVSHVVIDEVHERSLDTDFLLVLLRDVLRRRKDLKLILMSATLDASTFENYFKSTSSVGKIEIEGRTYPVQDVYIDEVLELTGLGSSNNEEPSEELVDEDPRNQTNGHNGIGTKLRTVGARINYDLIAKTVQYIDNDLGYEDGAILIFLPGVPEINQALRALRDVPGLYPLPLHASLQSSEQRLVFKSAPSGLRKVVAATNVAETSITIEDVVAVIDSGRVKETSFDPATNMVRLAEQWASRAACKQRRGRAGRVRPGVCYKLFTKSAERNMAERPEPEIRRVPLEQLCLSVKAMGVEDVPAFLASALTPPESLAVEGALALLGRMGALDGNAMTALGRHLSMIPADLRCGKLLVLGAAFGCLDACVTIAAILTVKSPFISPQAKREESKLARATFGGGDGDLLCDMRAYHTWDERRSAREPNSMLRRWCDENFLHHQTLVDIAANRAQYISSLKEIGFLRTDYSSSSTTSMNANNDNNALLRALIAGAFQPQLARIEFPDTKFAASSSGAVALDPEARTIKYFNEDNGRVFVHPSSTMFDAQAFPGHSVFMSYFTKMATSKVFVRDLTPFNVYSLLMFSGPITIDPQGRGLLVDGWIRLRGWARIGVLVSRLRQILDDLLARKIDDPGLDMSTNAVVGIVSRLVMLDGMDR